MKKIKRLTSLAGTALLIAIFISSMTSVSAASNSDEMASSQNYTVSKSEVDAGWAKAKTKAVVPDKKTESNRLTLSENSNTGTYPIRSGVILVTSDAYKGIIPTGHAAIIWTASTVVESLSQGVTTGLNNWNSSKTTCYAVTVGTTTASQDEDASNWCYSEIGKPYNYNFFNIATRAKFYCSQLVWASFNDLDGIDLNTSAFSSFLGNPIHPMELVNNDKTVLIYKHTN